MKEDYSLSFDRRLLSDKLRLDCNFEGSACRMGYSKPDMREGWFASTTSSGSMATLEFTFKL